MSSPSTGKSARITASDPVEEAFRELPPARRRRAFFDLSEPVRERLLDELSDDEIVAFLRRLDPDEAADVLGLLDEGRRERAVAEIDDWRREKAEFLLQFSPESAAGMMDVDFVRVDADGVLADAADRVERRREKTGRFPSVYVFEDDELLGELPPQALAVLEPDEPLRGAVEAAPTVRFDDDEEAVLETFRAHPNRRIAVLDDEDQILGVIHADDLVRAFDEHAGETLYEFTGVADEESVLDGPMSKVARRYKWLLLNLATAFLAAAVVGLFEKTIQAFTLLAVYMPIVAGMGGNAGTQSMAVTVRGIALDQVSLGNGLRVIWNEIVAGACNGLITGVVVALIAAGVNRNPIFGAVLAVSMVLNLVIAGLFGALIPMVLDRYDFDPATSATIFITTATDVLGFFVFLGLAALWVI